LKYAVAVDDLHAAGDHSDKDGMSGTVGPRDADTQWSWLAAGEPLQPSKVF